MRTKSERAGAGTLRVWGAGPWPAVLLGSSPLLSLLPRGSGLQSADAGGGGAVSRAPPCAVGPRGPCSYWPARWAAWAPPLQRHQKAIKGNGGARFSTAAPPGCERLQLRTQDQGSSGTSGSRLPRASPSHSCAPRSLLYSSPPAQAPALPQSRALGWRRQLRDSSARHRVSRQRLGRRPRPAAPSAHRLPGSPLFAPALGSAHPGRPQSFPAAAAAPRVSDGRGAEHGARAAHQPAGHGVC